MIRILLVDDQILLCEVLQTWLEVEKDFEVVGRAHNGHQAIEQVKVLRPDIVLMDVEMPEMDGITATRLISQQFPEVKIIVLSAHDDYAYLANALEAGAKSYLPKNTSGVELANTIRSVNEGNSQLDTDILEQLQQKSFQELEKSINLKLAEIRQEILQFKVEVQATVENASHNNASFDQNFQDLEQRIESKWTELHQQVLPLKKELTLTLEKLAQAEGQYQQDLSVINTLKLDLENTLKRLNDAGFNPANFRKVDNLQEQLNAYKSFVHQINNNLKGKRQSSIFAAWIAIIAMVIASAAIALQYLN